MEIQSTIAIIFGVGVALSVIYYGIQIYKAKKNDGKISLDEIIHLSSEIEKELINILKAAHEIKTTQNIQKTDFIDNFVETKIDKLIDETNLSDEDKKALKDINVSQLVNVFLSNHNKKKK